MPNFDLINFRLDVTIEDLKKKIVATLDERSEIIQAEFDSVVSKYFKNQWKEKVSSLIVKELDTQMEWAVKYAMNQIFQQDFLDKFLRKKVIESILEELEKEASNEEKGS